MSARPLHALPSLESLDDGGRLHEERAFRLVKGRKRSSVILGRGWLMRRMLLAADLLGLVIAFSVAQVAFAQDAVAGTVGRADEYLILLCLPVWIVLAKLYGLYDRDEERTSTRRSTTASVSSTS